MNKNREDGIFLFIRQCFKTKQLSRIKKIINIHYQCSLPDPTPSASNLKIQAIFRTNLPTENSQKGQNRRDFMKVVQEEEEGDDKNFELGKIQILISQKQDFDFAQWKNRLYKQYIHNSCPWSIYISFEIILPIKINTLVTPGSFIFPW